MLSKLLKEKKDREEMKNDKHDLEDQKPIHRCFSESSFFAKKAEEEKKVKKEYIFHLEVLNEPICLLFFNKREYTRVTYMLMKEVIFQDTYKFFSFTVCDDEISVFLDQNIVDRFINKNDHTYQYPNAVDRDYRAIRVYDSIDGVSHIGIVSKISTILATCNIPILYVNSYNNNYILVPDSELERAKKCLTETSTIIF